MALKNLSYISDDAVKWLRMKWETLRDSLIQGRSRSLTNRNAIISEGNREKTLRMGHMYFFHYQPKLREKLAYYDVFPLVIPVGYYAKGIIGMNFHYLPYNMRERLMKKLIGYLNEERTPGGRSAYLNITYNTLLPFTRFKEARPTIHKYDMTGSYVRSQFIHVEADEWNTALHLPVEEFRSTSGGDGVTNTEVWQDSRDKIGIRPSIR